MAREKEGFRENLARIDAKFPDKELLTVGEATAFIGRDYKTVIKLYGAHFTKKNGRYIGITKVSLAKAICV